jgi:hypothetical protein
VALGGDVVDGHGDLAVGLLAQGAAVLPLHADGVLALLGERDVVDEEDAVGGGERLGQAGAVAAEDLAFVPGALVDELLEGLLGVLAGQPLRQGHAAGERLDALAVAVEQQPLQVDAGPAGGLGLREVVGKEGGVASQPVKDRRVELRRVGLHGKLDARIGSGDSDI